MYGETCASVAMSMFAQQMLDLEPKGEYADVLEKELFNGSIAGISLDGKQYYYVNALETTPDGLDNPDRHHVLSHRVDWFAAPAARPTSPDSSPPWTATSTPSATAARPC